MPAQFLFSMASDYRIPTAVMLSIAWSWLWLRRRIFSDDARAILAARLPAPEYKGLENIPASGACLVTFNHYYRPGFNVMFLAMALAAVLPPQAGFVMTGELTYPGRWYAPLGMPASRSVLKRLARLYGFISMPPMPPRARDVAARAASVRATLTWLEETSEPLLILAPEGGDQPGGRLTRPPAGVGRFISLLAARGLKILPAAGWEQADRLCVRFGQPYTLALSAMTGKNELDRAASDLVMRAIAALLPENLRGDYND